MINPIRYHPQQAYASLALLLLIGALSGRVQAQDTSGKQLDAAIATLRNIQSDRLSEAQREAKGKEIDNSWEVLRAAGKSGVARLKQEIQKLDNSNTRDDFFKLNASSLIWQIARLDEAAGVATIWNSTPLDSQYSYVFYTAFEAAMTQDARALPMLEACLRDNKGKVFIPLHSLDIAWPLNIEFLWGSFGSKGLPALARILDESKDSVKVQSAMVLLTGAHYINALPAIRRLTGNPDKEIRRIAIRCLGSYGHPQDFELLMSGLSSSEPKVVFDFVYALYEYEDLRAVTPLIPLLKTGDESLRREVIGALIHLISAQSVDAVQQHCELAKSSQEKEECVRVKEQLDSVGLSLDAYKKSSAKERGESIRAIRRGVEEENSIKPGEKAATHDEFITRSRTWKEKHRLTCDGDDSSCTDWTVLAAATPSDLDVLLDVKGSLFARLSDECLYEVRNINTVIRKLGRSRYRKIVGLTDNVEPR